MSYITMKELEGAKVKGGGLGDEFPYLDFEKDGVSYRAEVQRDSEGNGPGFLFGLPMPNTPELKELREEMNQNPSRDTAKRLDELWSGLYYGSASGAVVTGTGENPPDEEGLVWEFISLEIDLDGETVKLSVEPSRDEEGNGPGFLNIQRI